MSPLTGLITGLITALIFVALYIWVVVTVINDLYRPERRVYGGNKEVWAVIIFLFSVLGILAYYYYGREN